MSSSQSGNGRKQNEPKEGEHMGMLTFPGSILGTWWEEDQLQHQDPDA